MKIERLENVKKTLNLITPLSEPKCFDDMERYQAYNICGTLEKEFEELNINTALDLEKTLQDYLDLQRYLNKHCISFKTFRGSSVVGNQDIYEVVGKQDDLLSLIETLAPLVKCEISFKLAEIESDVEYYLEIGFDSYEINEYQYEVLRKAGVKEVEMKWW